MPARKSVRPVSPKVGCHRNPWSGHPALERPIACMLDILPACRFGLSGIVCALLRRAATKPRHDHVTTFQPKTVTPPQSPGPPPFPGIPSLQTIEPCSALPSEVDANPGKAQGFKAPDHLVSRNTEA